MTLQDREKNAKIRAQARFIKGYLEQMEPPRYLLISDIADILTGHIFSDLPPELKICYGSTARRHCMKVLNKIVEQYGPVVLKKQMNYRNRAWYIMLAEDEGKEEGGQ